MALSLDSALSGLRAAQRQLEVISGNVSNSSTEGYSRKVLGQESQVGNGVTVGVTTSPITRTVDMNIQKEVWTQVSAASFSDIQANYLSQIQTFNGPPDKQLSIAATIAGLQDDFIQLANAPDDQTQMAQTVIQAQAVAKKFNSYSTMITQMRNDTQTQISDSVSKANELLKQIADANGQVKFGLASGQSVAAYQDRRDTAIKSLSEIMGVTTFTRGDGVLVVQTVQGQQLTDETASQLGFAPAPIGVASAYPASAAALYIMPANGQVTSSTPNITAIGVGGKIGAYLEMRDSTLPKYQAQLDEMAQKLASRFDAQGVRLFTDQSGTVPADTAPSVGPPIVAVPYVGFSATIQVNTAIVRDNTLIQKSTLPSVNVQTGSSEFLNRIIDYAFGANEYQQALGSANIKVAAGVAPMNTLQNVFGLNPKAQVIGLTDIKTASTGVPLNQAVGNPFTPAGGPPLTDNFTLQFDKGGANDTGVLTIDLTAVDAAFPTPPAASGAAALVSYLNTNVIAGLGAPLSTKITASLNQFGQLNITSQVPVDIGSGDMGTPGLTYLGLTAGSTGAAVNPYFDIQIGADNPVRVAIAPGDTEVTLLAKLNAVPGVQASINTTTGFLSIRPGPGFGGDLKIVAGPILSTGGNSIVKQIFGTDSPISNVANAAFRTNNLGPLANISTGVVSNGVSITDFAQKVITAQSQDASNATSRQADDGTYRDLISKQFQDSSGVNLDEELSQLIVIQTAYSASAKTISTLNDMFKQLIDAF